MKAQARYPVGTARKGIIFNKIMEIAAFGVGCAMAMSSATAHAGWFSDTVAKVTPAKPSVASKVGTPVRDKADELIQRAQETQATINAVIAETDVIKSRLEPIGEAFETVKDLKSRFDAMAFNPAEMLDSPEFLDAIEMLKERRRIAQERFNDPHVETFRDEFLDTLGVLRTLMPEEMQVMRTSPLERLVANAPRTVMVLIKAAAEETFSGLQANTRQLAGDVDELRQLDLMDDFSSESVMCNAYGFGADAIYFKALRAKKRLVRVVTGLKLIANEVPFTPMKFGIHGYVEAVQIDPGRTTKDKIEMAVIALEGLGERLDLVRETAEFYAGVGPCGG